MVFCLSCLATPALAEKRRAFVVGIQRYNDGYIQQLSRTINDAKDVAKDLEEAGFDRKNVWVFTDLKNKSAFDREFNAFLKTVEEGDTVLFYFSGHGFGLEADQTNYLLLSDLKSPFSYTRSQMPDKERKNSDVIRLKIPSMLEAYQQNEIPKSGVSATEVEKKLAERKPKTVIMILDACRSLVTAGSADPKDVKRVKRGDDSGSRMVTSHQPPTGFLLLYSASFGEQAVESFGPNDNRRNSVFTEVLRSELHRPGQSLVELAERVKLMVRAIAQQGGWQQEPEVVSNLGSADDFQLVASIGRERFQLTLENCDGGREDWDQIKGLRNRELLERHRRRFAKCPTAELARQAIAQLSLSPEESVDLSAAPPDRSTNDCDRFAASELDPARPPEVRGVAFEKMDAEAGVTACLKAVQENPRVPRFLFNLGRAYQRLATQPGIDPKEQTATFRRARLAYDDAAKRGYISALNNLAVLYENGYGVDQNDEEAANLFKRAAQQGHPLAMYNLSLRYRYGMGAVRRDFPQAYEWAAKAAETGFVPAMVELGTALEYGRGLTRNNPRRAVEWYLRAADGGSARAKFELGLTYLYGSPERGLGAEGMNGVSRDPTLALLWLGRVAADGNSDAQALLAQAMEEGFGLPNPQPEIAERYWRLAAHGGSRKAEVEFADRIRQGFVVVKQEYGENEGVMLLRRALSQGSPKAALYLAQVYRKGELGQEKQPIEAMKLAYRTIELAEQADPTDEDGQPFHEIAAAHLLVEMAKNGEAVDTTGRPLLTQEEIERLERYYGVGRSSRQAGQDPDA